MLKKDEPGMLALVCSPSYSETEAGGLFEARLGNIERSFHRKQTNI
jgi:hypothetical protein